MRFWKKALIIAVVTFAGMATLFTLYGETITCEQVHNTSDWLGKCGITPERQALAWTIVVGAIIFTLCALYAAWRLKKVLNEFGETMARAGRHTEQADPYPGNPHEDTKANRDEDPR